jgi:carbon-monoxide dehydrogenase medium subunit
MLRPFTLHRPVTADEACDLLTRLGPDASPYAGGTELLLLMKLGFASPQHLVDVKRVAGFGQVEAAGERVRIGAAVTHRTVERSTAVRARCPLLSDVARHIANVRVRNVGTVGGNLAFADPHSDLATLLLAMDGRVELVSPRGRRELPIGEFVVGPWQTARQPDELLAAVSVMPWPAGTAATYVKFGVHERPTLGVAVALLPDNGRVAAARVTFGCVNPAPVRVTSAEARLAGVTLAELGDVTPAVAAMTVDLVDAVDDLHGSADYKREMIGVFTRRALAIARARAMAGTPAARYPYTVVA